MGQYLGESQTTDQDNEKKYNNVLFTTQSIDHVNTFFARHITCHCKIMLQNIIPGFDIGLLTCDVAFVPDAKVQPVCAFIFRTSDGSNIPNKN